METGLTNLLDSLRTLLLARHLRVWGRQRVGWRLVGRISTNVVTSQAVKLDGLPVALVAVDDGVRGRGRIGT